VPVGGAHFTLHLNNSLVAKKGLLFAYDAYCITHHTLAQ